MAEYESGDDRPGIQEGNVGIVYLANGDVTFGAAGVTSVSFIVYPHGQPEGTKKVSCKSSIALESTYIVPCFFEKLDSASHNDTLQVDVVGSSTVSAYGRLVKHFSLASAANGFWIPIGIFGTNFRPNEDGITLAAVPIGIAWGVQWNISGTGHLGISGLLSWSIAPQKPKSQADAAATGNYTLASITPGAIVDFDGYAYLGYGYAADLRTDFDDPGHMGIFGFGPKLLQFLKAEPK